MSIFVAGSFWAALACNRTPSPVSSTGPATAERLDGAGGARDEAHSQLARVRPPAPLCETSRATPNALIAHAAAAFEKEEFALALACAEDALELAPRAVPALHYRAAALVALGKIAEGRLAYAQALAIDPDDAEVLYGAADLYVLRLSGDRPEIALGREYALRGARIARRGPHGDRELAGELLVLAATAENDLGESREARQHADEALQLGASETDARYERGVALYELCKFNEAQQSLARVLELTPNDAWANYYLGLVAERLGQAPSAERYAARARQLAPDEFSPLANVGRATVEQEVRQAVTALPEGDRRALRHVPVRVEETPALDDLVSVDPPLSPSILGLFRGPPENEPCAPEDGAPCRSIVLYSRNLVRFARDRQELQEQVKVTLLHEIGHLHGETDEQLRARGLE